MCKILNAPLVLSTHLPIELPLMLTSFMVFKYILLHETPKWGVNIEKIIMEFMSAISSILSRILSLKLLLRHKSAKFKSVPLYPSTDIGNFL